MNSSETTAALNSDTLAALALSLVPGIGPKLQTALVQTFGSPGEVLQQSCESLMAVPGIGAKVANGLRHPELLQQACEELEQCHRYQISVLSRTHPEFPRRLLEICDPPAILYRRGRMTPQDELSIAVVGSRRCTTYGCRQAERLAAALARAGFTIVSGLARGIDAAAHRGALNAGGRTLAVLATGVRQIYPPEHADLALDVIGRGALLSEMPLDQKPRPGLFPQRNRIISGLCLGVIVVEATRRSGALYTARHGLEQGREVFAVPGQVDSLASDGCHELIRDGVTLVRNVDDILAELGPLSVPAATAPQVTIHNPRELTLNALESEVLNCISTTPIHVDEILRELKMDPSRVLATLTVLEMRRFVRRLAGNVFVRHD